MSRDGDAGDVARMNPAARAYVSSLRCLDCLSDTEPHEVRPGVFIVNVIHDESCPAYLVVRQ